jgi:hypothetical protein
MESIRDVLNSTTENGHPLTPRRAGNPSTTRGVEMVLFMDGY